MIQELLVGYVVFRIVETIVRNLFYLIVNGKKFK